MCIYIYMCVCVYAYVCIYIYAYGVDILVLSVRMVTKHRQIFRHLHYSGELLLLRGCTLDSKSGNS